MRKLFLIGALVALVISCGRKSETINYESDGVEYEMNVGMDEGESKDVVELTISGLDLTHELDVAEHYEGIIVRGAWHVIVSDSVQRPTVIADEILMPYLKVEVKDNNLEAGYSRAIHYRGRVSDAPILKVPSTIRLNLIELSGASKFENTIPLQGDSLEIDIEGASKADINALQIAKYIDLEVAGSSKVVLNCNVEYLDIESAGASKLTLMGKAQRFDVEMAGACKVDSEKKNKKYQFEVDEANIEMAGASKLELHCNNQLNVEAAGAGSVKYSGNPRINKDAAGVVSVKKVK